MNESIPNSENNFEFIPKSRQKANEIAEERIFGYKPFTGEQIEKVREPIRKSLTEFGANFLAGPSGLLNFVTGLVGTPKSVRKYIPTPEDFKKNIESFTGESLESSNPWEKMAQDISGKAGTIASLGGARTGAGLLGVPITGEAVKQGLKYGGAPEWMQTTGVLLTDLLMGKKGLANPRETASAFHRQAERLIPQGASVNGQNLLNDMQNIVTRLSRGGHNPETAPVIAKANEIIQRIQQGNGAIDPRDIYAFRTAVNAIRGDPATLQGGRKWLDSLNHLLNRELTTYGTQQNPQFLATLNEGDQIVQGLSNGRRAMNFLRAKVPENIRNNPVAAMLMFLKPKQYLTHLGLVKSGEIGHQLLFSPAIRRYYGNAVRYSLEGNGKGAIHEMQKLVKESKKEFPQLEEGEFEYSPKS